MIAVSNTSPLILFDKVDHLWILGRLFNKVLIPPSVDKEWLRPGDYVTPGWIFVENLSNKELSDAEKFYLEVDIGEAEAIALFRSIKADTLLFDDLKARRLAKSLEIPVIGTLGLLIAAKHKGIISEIKPLLEGLKRHRFYISDEALKMALLLAKE
ncbi:DUF3368 domain-containing protein [Dissulfurispira thermophila]|uniref:DUF3368 domain-containing protein n=1 Tax=Dissulfurispira thermophila TaxID=2715679 RepID=A0A7G1H571_9BACT|nr:DUF3368 domain-containing protein [Dissulfurispira thermophila]BCB97066.1 DUF3368 domain-containing protein [Dissulfurispira thermophila]